MWHERTDSKVDETSKLALHENRRITEFSDSVRQVFAAGERMWFLFLVSVAIVYIEGGFFGV